MAKMHFKYASMNAGKSIDLIRTAYNYEENGYKVLIVKSAIDTKADDKISSRIGAEKEVDAVFLYSDSIIEKLKDEYAITLAKSYIQGMKRIGLGKADSIKYLKGIDD